MKHFGELFFLVVAAWFVWVLFGATPHTRLRRACDPVAWTTDSFTAFSRATNSDYTYDLNYASNTLDYRCQIFLWDYFYRASFLQRHPGITKKQADRYEVAHLYYVQHNPQSTVTKR